MAEKKGDENEEINEKEKQVSATLDKSDEEKELEK